MAHGEFVSQREMKNSIPENAAEPLAWGPLDNNPSHAFYMCELRDLYVPEDTRGNAVKPSPSEVASIMIGLHRASSPNGEFGFPLPTFKGYAPMNNEWCDKWEDWFARQFRMDIRFKQSLRGPDPEMDELLDKFVEKVIPRLLRPLQTGGRSIKPSLVHTDIWHGNIHRDRASQKPIIFDACCVYGHYESKLAHPPGRGLADSMEVELGMFREQHYGWSPEYIQEYLKEVQPSEPREDFDDRISLYAM